MSSLSVLPLGVGDAFSERYYSSCLALHANGAWRLIHYPDQFLVAASGIEPLRHGRCYLV